MYILQLHPQKFLKFKFDSDVLFLVILTWTCFFLPSLTCSPVFFATLTSYLSHATRPPPPPILQLALLLHCRSTWRSTSWSLLDGVKWATPGLQLWRHTRWNTGTFLPFLHQPVAFWCLLCVRMHSFIYIYLIFSSLYQTCRFFFTLYIYCQGFFFFFSLSQ